MTTFVALYRGETVVGAKLIAVSTSPHLVAEIASALLQITVAHEDTVIGYLERGRRNALSAIHREAISDAHKQCEVANAR